MTDLSKSFRTCAAPGGVGSGIDYTMPLEAQLALIGLAHWLASLVGLALSEATSSHTFLGVSLLFIRNLLWTK